MIVGDAAGQTKPISGGGLFTGLRCATYAAETAIEALEQMIIQHQSFQDMRTNGDPKSEKNWIVA